MEEETGTGKQMTTEERFERMEHVTAGLAEHLRKDREESRQLWRDTQRQINELAVHMNDLTLKVADTNEAITRLAEETRAAHQQLREEIRAADQQLREESRAADQQLRERIESLVSAIGKLLAK